MRSYLPSLPFLMASYTLMVEDGASNNEEHQTNDVKHGRTKDGGFWSKLGCIALRFLLCAVLIVVAGMWIFTILELFCNGKKFESIFFQIVNGFLRFVGISFLLFLSMGLCLNFWSTEAKSEVEKSMLLNTKFKDVKGAEDAKAELEEIVQYLRDPKRFNRLGGKLQKGVLLVGPPGTTSKTMLAIAVAGEAGVPIFYRTGRELEQGVGAERVRNLFVAARAKIPSPCLIFIDDIDNITLKRTTDQLLTELDRLKRTDQAIIVIGATNYPECLNRTLTRPGCLDRKVVLSYPDVEGRIKIMESHMSAIPRASDVVLADIAKETQGFSGADLANLVNTAAIKASMDGCESVAMAHLKCAKEKIVMRSEGKLTVRSEKSRKMAACHEGSHDLAMAHPECVEERIMMGSEGQLTIGSEKSRKMTAYREGGHVLVAMYTEGAYPVDKVTMAPRENALSMVAQLPDDRRNMSRRQLLAMLDVLMGGRVAEELIFGEDEVRTGTHSDFQTATSLAIDMVTKYGMSQKIPFVTYKGMSEETRVIVEGEVKTLLSKAYKNAKVTLEDHKQELHELANNLLERETLTGDEIKRLLGSSNSRLTRAKWHINGIWN